MASSSVSIVSVTYNNEKQIKDYLIALKKALPEVSEVIIVDNHSSDHTAELVEKEKWLKLIKNKSNLGFGSGCNIGAKHSHCEYILFLNPDTVLEYDSLEKLINFAQSHPEAGIIAPRLISKNGIVQESVTRLPSLLGAVKEYIFGQKNAYSQYVPATDTPVEVEAVYGAAMLIKKELFNELGGFDEKYFLYYEDLDLCRKIRSKGLKILYCPDISIVHLVGESTTSSENLPAGLQTLAHFIPLKRSGSYYYLVQGGYLYHGIFIGFLIKLIIYLAHFGSGRTSAADN